YVGEVEKKTRNTIYYRLPTLRHKKQCAHNVAHECAHASPA
ncbi:15526_t:CDS:1, partial [Racocetra persica]